MLNNLASPSFRVAVSEFARPEIAEQPDCGCGYDIWIGWIGDFQKNYATFRYYYY